MISLVLVKFAVILRVSAKCLLKPLQQGEILLL